MPLKQNVPPDSSAKQSSVSARSLFQLSSCPQTSCGSPVSTGTRSTPALGGGQKAERTHCFPSTPLAPSDPRALYLSPRLHPMTLSSTGLLRHEQTIKNKLIRPEGLKQLERFPIWKCRGIISDKQARSKE